MFKKHDNLFSIAILVNFKSFLFNFYFEQSAALKFKLNLIIYSKQKYF